MAKGQTSARGRQGRSWSKSEVGFYGTYVFQVRHAEKQERLYSFPLVAGCVLHQVFAGLGADVLLKWPNDILAKDAGKLAGILIEFLTQPSRTALLVGIGVNLVGEPHA